MQPFLDTLNLEYRSKYFVSVQKKNRCCQQDDKQKYQKLELFFFHFQFKTPCFDPQSLHCEMSPLRRLAHLEIFVISGRATQQRCSRRQCGSLSKDEVTTETGLNGLFISEMATICICTLHLKDPALVASQGLCLPKLSTFYSLRIFSFCSG